MYLFKYIPNTITSMNLLCGAMGVIFCFQGRSDISFYLMLAAALFDFSDGFAARLLNAYSDMGKELDSLADMVSFGLLPSLMMHKIMIDNDITGVIAYIPLIICIFSALRLAKFNIDTRQSENFLGLATPACAMICGSLVYAARHNSTLAQLTGEFWFIPVLSIVLAILLVVEIPMFSLKFKKGSSNSIRIYFIILTLLIGAITLILGINWSFIVLLTFTCYIILNIIRFVTTIISNK